MEEDPAKAAVAEGSATSSRESTKQLLIRTGHRILREKGYSGTGLQEVLQSCNVPKGSFYHFFASKEDFGLAIIDYDAAQHKQELDSYLEDEHYTPLVRLRRYFEMKCQYFQARRHREGCLVGKLAQELAEQNETFRVRIERFFADWESDIARCLVRAQQAGEIPLHLDAHNLAAFLINSWEGALAQMKVNRSTLPLQIFMDFSFKILLQNRFVP
ncbi:TetR/AcrR family transcriptional regulator [Gloeobacter kilaueensis]|uniref:TetR family transcriptional regulator n=1 Tax=Gloeobacter kilaueensis (strain ATCC BAA-2537 / CCAP 1431/1 / ULC 316 / JS1) TaxID=1183438 RepID=U5QR03_GLOK1|nr:TetR/AcrR family transcriptional regulator [Gloeobacter kilaueensis]AGY60145.1 TetR family transcriptional regulator [Gloeobacter kilaueensis JS1]